jgi:hypothetical protein
MINYRNICLGVRDERSSVEMAKLPQIAPPEITLDWVVDGDGIKLLVSAQLRL